MTTIELFFKFLKDTNKAGNVITNEMLEQIEPSWIEPEKQQIMDAYNSGYDSCYRGEQRHNAETYYEHEHLKSK